MKLLAAITPEQTRPVRAAVSPLQLNESILDINEKLVTPWDEDARLFGKRVICTFQNEEHQKQVLDYFRSAGWTITEEKRGAETFLRFIDC